MLRAERSPLSPDVANELRDALRRRQKELPARWLAAHDAAAVRDQSATGPGHDHEALEIELGLTLLRDTLPDVRPRGIVCIQPSGSRANLALADALCGRGSVTSVAAAELDSKLAADVIERLTSRGIRESSSAIACDCTVDLPLPDQFPRPRVYLCLGNALGSTTTVGAVRLLRVLRTTMNPNDGLVLGLDGCRNTGATSAGENDTAASRHLGALGLLNTTVGASFDLSRFEYKPTYDSENDRSEAHLVAKRAFEVAVPGICDLRFRKGESIRTGVRCRFDRSRVAAMLAGVGLTLREWSSYAHGGFVVAFASPAV